jgi:uncharacterized protein with HEPN domain
MRFEVARSYFGDILDSIHLIQQFVRDMDLDDYRRDEKTQAVVERKMLIISKAAIRLKDTAEALCPGMPWRDIGGRGNWLRHQYDNVEVETIWNTVQDVCHPSRRRSKRHLQP